MKGLQVTKKVRSYEKGKKMLRNGYEVTKKIRSYEKVRSYEKGTKRLRNKLQKVLVTKLPIYEIVTPPIGIIYYDVLLWRIVMHYMKIKWQEFPMAIGRGRRREHPNQHFLLLLRKRRGGKTGMRRTYFRWRQFDVTSAQKAPVGRILTSPPVMWLPVAPLHSTTANATWAVPIYYSPVYGVYISQLIQYSKACGSYQDFLDRGLLLTRKLLNQGFLLVKSKSTRKFFYGRNHDLVDRYGISVSQMTSDMFHLP